MDTTAELLRSAAKTRAISLLFTPPSEATTTELRSLAGDIRAFDEEFGGRLASLTDEIDGEHSVRYHCALGPTGCVRDSESDYEVNPLGGKGPLIADVAGFYLAFKYEDATFEGLGFDHFANECGFVGWMAFREAFARHEGDGESASVCEDARAKFMRDHVAKWTATFCARVRENSGDPWFVDAVDLCEQWLGTMATLDPAMADPRKRALPQVPGDDDGEMECGLPPDA